MKNMKIGAVFFSGSADAVAGTVKRQGSGSGRQDQRKCTALSRYWRQQPPGGSGIKAAGPLTFVKRN